MNVVSVSRRTDIPAFYSTWFMNRVRTGFAKVENAFNPRQVSTVPLAPDQVACFVFCTKDPRPLLPHLDELDRRGYHYLFQVTVTGLPQLFEPQVPAPREIVAAIREISRRIGPRAVVWRFDPIVISELTPPDRLVERFAELAAGLQGNVHRVIVSFMRPYRSATGRIGRSEARKAGVRFLDADEIMTTGGPLAARLREIAERNGMEIFSCAERADLAPFGVRPGACIDGSLIREIFGIALPGKKDQGQRPECGCIRSLDIGAYGTCPHRCLYCYASTDTRLRSRRHDPDGEALLTPLFTPPQPELF
jgi:hypothetical protein